MDSDLNPYEAKYPNFSICEISLLIQIFLCVLVILVDQTDKPNWLAFIQGTHGYPGGNIKICDLVFKNLFFSDFLNFIGNARHF